MIEKLVGDIPRIKTDEGSYYIGDEGIKHCKVCDEALETVVRESLNVINLPGSP